MSSIDKKLLFVDDLYASFRLDRFLAASLPDYSRSRLQALLAQGMVSRGEVVISSAAVKVKAGETYQLTIPPLLPSYMPAQEIALDVIYEDNDLLVINKAAGLTVHPAPGHPDGTLVNALLAHCGASLSGIGGALRPGIVHRLDKDTSGLMVVAKHDAAHHALSAQLAERSLSRIYHALCWGTLACAQGAVKANIGRSLANRQKMAVLRSGGKAAVTNYRVINNYNNPFAASLVECKLESGRTHQIRVHMLHIGNPIVGDPLYGQSTAARLKNMSADLLTDEAKATIRQFTRQALHATKIGFIHPQTARKMEFSAEIPDDMKKLLSIFSKN